MLKIDTISEEILKDLKIKAGLYADTPDEVITNCRNAYNDIASYHNAEIDSASFDERECATEYAELFISNAEYLKAFIDGYEFIHYGYWNEGHGFGYWYKKDRDYREEYIKTLKKALNLKPDTPESVIDGARKKCGDGYEWMSNEEFMLTVAACDYKKWCKKWSKYCGEWSTYNPDKLK